MRLINCHITDPHTGELARAFSIDYDDPEDRQEFERIRARAYAEGYAVLSWPHDDRSPQHLPKHRPGARRARPNSQKPH